MIVDVYFNIRRGIWSVRRAGKVVGHCKTLILRNAKFMVSEAGRQRVLREQCKNIHAWVRGELIEVSDPSLAEQLGIPSLEEQLEIGFPARRPQGDDGGCYVRYNPYLYRTFVDQDDLPVHHATEVLMSHGVVTAWGVS